MMIDRTDLLPVSKQAKLLGLNRDTVYYLPRVIRQEELDLVRQIDQLLLEHPFMGQRMLVRDEPQPTTCALSQVLTASTFREA